MTRDDDRQQNHPDDAGIPTLTVRQPRHDLPTRTGVVHSPAAGAFKRETAAPNMPPWHVDEPDAYRLPPLLTEEATGEATAYALTDDATTDGRHIVPGGTQSSSVSSVSGNAPTPAEPVLRAALQAAVEDAVEDALNEATAHLRARLQARLPEIIAHVLRQTRSG